MSTLFIEVVGLYLSCHEPASPAVVVRDKVVIDACEVSLAAGIRVGMGAGQAKAILHDLTCFAFVPELYEVASKAWLNRLCSVSDSVEVINVHQAYVDLSGHPDPFLTALEVCSDLPFVFRGGVSPCHWVARSLAPASGLLHFPRPAAALADQSIVNLTPISLQTRERLAFLGYRTIGEIQQLSLATLKSQFGLEALTIRQAAMGMLHEPVVGNYPPNSISRRLPMEGGCEDSDAILAGLRRLSAQLASALNEADQEAKALELVIDFENGSRMIDRHFGRAMHSATRIATALSQLWIELAVSDPVYQLRAIAREVGPSTRRQVSLTGLVNKNAEMPNEDLERLARKYGSEVILAASQVKIPRRKEVLRVLRATTGWY